MSVIVFGLHYLAYAAALACLSLQLFNLRRLGEVKDLRVGILARVDAWYGMMALTSIATGLLRVFIYGKGAAYYATHPVFWTKMAIFAAIGLLSIYPTVQFLKNRELTVLDWSANRSSAVIRIRRVIQIEILLYLILPFVAAQLAHGSHF